MLRRIKRIRDRFGISAPKMTVRTHVAWYWRWLGIVAALAVSSSRRSAALPDVPTVAEQGVSGFSIDLWFGMWAPAGTPGPVVQKLNAEVGRILQLSEVREQYGTLGVEPVTMTPPAFATFVREEIATYQRIVREANIPRQ